MNTIIYEDEHIQVLHRHGKGKVLIVTFGDMFSLANGSTFFAETPAKKNNMHAIGFMAKIRNWYPKTSVQLAISALKKTLRSTDTVIIYGGSMGGYAALKYSKLLNASRVYALVPQYSIDPEIIKDHRYNQYFTNDLHHNNAITFDDLSGVIYITHDPAYKMDDAHVKLIASLGYPLEKIPLRFSIHGATTVLASSLFFNEITKPEAIDKHSLYKIFKDQRRKSRSYVEGLVEYLSLKRNHYALNIIFSGLESGLLLRNRRLNETISKCIRASHKNYDPSSDIRITGLSTIKKRNHESSEITILKTAHSKYLAYDALTNKIIQSDTKELTELPFIFPLIIKDRHGLITLQCSKSEPTLTYANHEFELIEDNKNYNLKGYIIYRENNGYYTISNLTKNLSASPNGRCTFNVEHVNNWEKFYAEKLLIG